MMQIFDLRLSPGEVWSWRVECGFSVLRQKRGHSSGYNHPCSHHTDAALHRRVRLLLQVRQIIPKTLYIIIVFLCVDVFKYLRVCVFGVCLL